MSEHLRQPESGGQSPPASQETMEDFWMEWVEKAFPALEARAYFLPPNITNIRKLAQSEEEDAQGTAGPSNPPATSSSAQTTSVQPTTGEDSDARDDSARQRMMIFIQNLLEKNGEVFFVLTQFKFGQYLGQPCYAAAAAQIPLPNDLASLETKNWKEGDFDILLIHRCSGLFICEVKTFGDKVKSLNMSHQDINDNIRKKLREAVSQLDKAEVVLSHLVHDVAPGLRVCKVIALPNLTTRQVQQAVEDDPHLSQELCQCLGAADLADITGLCLCSDQLSDSVASSDGSDNALTKLRERWQRQVTVSGSDCQITSDLYKRLVARFCGPATAESCPLPQQSCVRFLGQPESLTGQRFALRTLHPEQLVLLSQGLPRVILDGNVNDIKMLLLLTAIEWLQGDNTVYVVSTNDYDQAHIANINLYITLQQFIKTSNQVRLLKYDFHEGEEVEKAVNYLSQASKKNHLYVIVVCAEIGYWSVGFKTFCEALLRQVPDIHLWAAAFLCDNSPSGYKPICIEGFEDFGKSVKLASGVASPVSRCHIIGQDHPQGGLYDCEQCGKELVRFLRSLADQEPLQWTDVVLMSEKWLKDGAGFETGLRSEGVPDYVIKDWWDTMRTDYIYNEILPDFGPIHEHSRRRRRVVVYLDEDTSVMDEALKDAARICTFQLVIVSHSKQPGRCVQSQTCGQIPGRSGLSPFAGQQATSCKQTEDFWMKWVENALPDLENKSYFVPPVFMNRVSMTRMLAAGEEVLVPREAPGMTAQSNLPASSPSGRTKSPQPTPVQDSNIRDDAAVQRVILCLQKLSETNRGVFVALTQLKFGQYLGDSCYSAAAAQLPSPKNLPAHHPKSWKDGDFDVLLIHRHYGLVICEVKAFGDNTKSLNMSQQDVDSNIRKKLRQAVGQLDKAEVVLSHLVHDVALGLRVCKVIALPNLTARQVQQAVTGSPQLLQELCRCLGAADPADITGLCLCCDQLSDPRTPWDVNDLVLRELKKWWQRRVAVSGPDRQMTSELYKRLVARFCGPATTVTVPCVIAPRLHVKTLAQAVSATGMCFAEITLFPEQLNLLQRGPPRVLLHGPPGTGKTVMLQLMATDWLRNKKFVHVVSTWDKSLPSCTMLYNLLQQTLDKEGAGTPSQLDFLKYEFREETYVEKAVNDLVQTANKNPLHVIVDEVDPRYGQGIFKTFCEKLLEQVPDLRLWAASYLQGLPPNGWEQESLTRPVRSPPTVVREVEKAEEIRFSKDVQAYSATGIPSHTDGPRIKFIGQGHSQGRSPKDCEECGRELGRFLWTLKDPAKASETSNSTSPANSNVTASCPDPLQWRDVFVLWWSGVSDNAVPEPGLDEKNNPSVLSGRRLESDEDTTNHDSDSESGFNNPNILSGLMSECVPVQEMTEEDTDDVATAARDVVWVADYDAVRGLERKVVVCLDMHGLENNPVRLHAMSRCTSQLVIVTHSPYVLGRW